jgi:hypothetical protein
MDGSEKKAGCFLTGKTDRRQNDNIDLLEV